MKLRYEVMVAAGEYTDRDGKSKTRWLKVGAILQNERGKFSLKMESMPVGWDGWASLFEPRAKEQPSSQTGDIKDMKDDIPW